MYRHLYSCQIDEKCYKMDENAERIAERFCVNIEKLLYNPVSFVKHILLSIMTRNMNFFKKLGQKHIITWYDGYVDSC